MFSSTRQEAKSDLVRPSRRAWLVLLLLIVAVGGGFIIRSWDTSQLAGETPIMSTDHPGMPPTPKAQHLLSSCELSFIENAGQWPKEVRFYAKASGAAMWFTDAGVYYDLMAREHMDRSEIRLSQVYDSELNPAPERVTVHSWLANANPAAFATGENRLAQYSNFFHGDDPSMWRTRVAEYGSVVYHDIYPGIDLRYYSRDGKPEYDFVLQPGVDPDLIRMKHDGVASITVQDGGALALETERGSIVESPPQVYQRRGEETIQVEARFAKYPDGTVGFAMETEVDPTLALVIDPTIVFSTFLGGSSDDGGENPGNLRSSLATDGSGNAFVVSYSFSPDFPLVAPLDGTLGGSIDAVVTKFDSSGGLLFSTYLGGPGDDYGIDVAVDAAGFVYVSGLAVSSFPTVNPYQAAHAGAGDAFLTKLTNAGDAILYSTYFGGSTGSEWGITVAVDDAGDAYVCGEAFGTTNLPTTINAYQPTFGGGLNDGFIAKLSPSIGGPGSLVYASYLGGIGNDVVMGVAVDSQKRASVALGTQSSNLPTDRDGYAADWDIYMARFSAAGDSLKGATYYGGANLDWPWSLAMAPSGDVYVVAICWSVGQAVGGYDSTYGGNGDGLIASFNPDSLMKPISSTYLGGTAFDRTRGICVDAEGFVYATGYTQSIDFPLVSAVDSTRAGEEAYLAIFSADLAQLRFSSYLGASSSDRGQDVAVGSPGLPYVVGYTLSSDFPVTSGAFDNTYNGSNDIFLAKITGFDFDVDGDGIVNGIDNCPDIYNPSQADGDLDAIGDVCDNCPAASNNDQADVDMDGIGDVCDPCAFDPLNDADGDGLCADVDNCPTISNPGQADTNSNGIGDACDIGEQLQIYLFSPVDMVVTDPAGDSIGIGFNTIGLGSSYDTLTDLNSSDLSGPDGDADDIVTIPAPTVGDYRVRVIAEPGAGGGDHFTMSIRINGNQLFSPDGYADQLVSALGSTVPDTYTYTTALTLPGDVNADGAITSADIIYMVGYVFKGGTPPVVPGHSDVNCDGNDTSADIIALVNFVFKSGVPPCSPGVG